MQFRIGQGIDIHPFEEGRRLVLGGVEIPFHRGLSGHSDADVVLHALTDAVLGALSWGDLGEWFPNTDPAFAGADSAQLFSAVWAKARDAGWSLVNCDCTIIAQEPKIAPHAQQMKECIAALFLASPAAVGLKATTAETLGFVGRKEGIVASAVVLLSKG